MQPKMIDLGPIGFKPERISFALQTRGEFAQLEVHGKVDAANVSEFRAVLLETVENCTHHIVVDITNVDFVDASGLGALVGALRHAHTENKRVDLACTDQKLLKIFALTSLDQSFGISESADDAIQAGTELLASSVIASSRNTVVAS